MVPVSWHGPLLGIYCHSAERRRAAISDSPNVHTDAPSSTMSLIRNWPTGDNAGNPPAAESVTPGVVNRKLNVLMNSRVAMALPTADGRGSQWRRATNTAAMISTAPSAPDRVRTVSTLSIQLINGLCAMYNWIRTASESVNFKAPIHATTTASP